MCLYRIRDAKKEKLHSISILSKNLNISVLNEAGTVKYSLTITPWLIFEILTSQCLFSSLLVISIYQFRSHCVITNAEEEKQTLISTQEKKKAHSKHRIINSVREKKHPHSEKECQYIVVDYLQPCVYNTVWKSQSFMYCVYDLMNGCTSKAYWQHAGSMWASHFLSSVRVELKRTVTAAFHWRSAQHVSIKGNSTKTEQISIIYEAQRMKEKSIMGNLRTAFPLMDESRCDVWKCNTSHSLIF